MYQHARSNALEYEFFKLPSSTTCWNIPLGGKLDSLYLGSSETLLTYPVSALL
jgi:hypothetical protein